MANMDLFFGINLEDVHQNLTESVLLPYFRGSSSLFWKAAWFFCHHSWMSSGWLISLKLPTVFFVVQLDSGIICLHNVFLWLKSWNPSGLGYHFHSCFLMGLPFRSSFSSFLKLHALAVAYQCGKEIAIINQFFKCKYQLYLDDILSC